MTLAIAIVVGACVLVALLIGREVALAAIADRAAARAARVSEIEQAQASLLARIETAEKLATTAAKKAADAAMKPVRR